MIRRTALWLLEDDLREFGRQVALDLPAAWWMCSRPGPRGLHQVHAHAVPEEALQCGGGVQCFLPLPAGAEPPGGALVDSGVSPTSGLAVSALVQLLPTVDRPADLFGAGHLQAGLLAVSFTEAQADEVARVWSVLHRVTDSAVLAGGPTGARISPAARDYLVSKELRVSLGGDERFLIA